MGSEAEIYMAAKYFPSPGQGFKHASVDREIAFYEAICSGNMELVRVFMKPLCCEGCGVLSEDPIRNMKYHMVVLAAIIARSCINGGMTPEQSYSLSDHYIMKTDKCRTEAEIRAVHLDMIEGYTKRMRQVRLSGVYSKQIVRAVDYIVSHLHGRILIKDAAEELGISPSYLSRLFKAETGLAFSDHVNRTKSEEAANLLLYSGYSDLEISDLFGFSSQSHFIRTFRKYMGMTPKEYKKRYKLDSPTTK
ncbi:MAG: helix-turn-helix transcriptional regulator [Ruminococcus sp.]|nr:helix-turn-helix transcriptional regulator [Ruminococcus sp.]